MPKIVQAFKSLTTKEAKQALQLQSPRLWQPNYFEHVVRSEEELARIREYVLANPLAHDLSMISSPLNPA